MSVVVNGQLTILGCLIGETRREVVLTDERSIRTTGSTHVATPLASLRRSRQTTQYYQGRGDIAHQPAGCLLANQGSRRGAGHPPGAQKRPGYLNNLKRAGALSRYRARALASRTGPTKILQKIAWTAAPSAALCRRRVWSHREFVIYLDGEDRGATSGCTDQAFRIEERWRHRGSYSERTHRHRCDHQSSTPREPRSGTVSLRKAGCVRSRQSPVEPQGCSLDRRFSTRSAGRASRQRRRRSHQRVCRAGDKRKRASNQYDWRRVGLRRESPRREGRGDWDYLSRCHRQGAARRHIERIETADRSDGTRIHRLQPSKAAGAAGNRISRIAARGAPAAGGGGAKTCFPVSATVNGNNTFADPDRGGCVFDPFAS